MLAVPLPTLPRKKASDAKRTPLHRPRIVPRYDGRWPFIGSSRSTPQDAFVLVGGGTDLAQQTHAAVRPKASCGRAYSGAVAMGNSPLQGVAIAAGIGFILALIVC